MVQSLPTRLILIRHASIDNPQDVIYGALPVPISDKGKTEIHDLLGELETLGIQPTVIYTSPLVRARQTAEILSSHYGNVSMIEDEDCRDVKTGSLQGQPMDLLREQKFAGEIHHTGGETQKDLMTRAVVTVEKLIAKHKGETIFIVSHGDWIRFALWHCQYPHREIDIKNLRDKDYLYPGEAVSLAFGEDQRFLEYQHIRREGFSMEERSKNPLKEA